ncbi:MAG: hypothetical protein KF878_00980 [Planctomycetes bacterium]|nr:hypothetical protein [Planctomycetota bacterium]
MAIGCTEYDREELPERGWQALREAVVTLNDHLQMDVEGLLRGGEFATTFASCYLPPKYLPSYDLGLLRRFLVCVVVTGWKLFDPAHEHRLACTAEELALRAIIQRAEEVLEEQEAEPVDFSYLVDMAYEDTDFEMLFDPSLDGIEDSPSGKYMRIVNLKLKEWFLPFNPERGDVVHPYADGAAWEKK